MNDAELEEVLKDNATDLHGYLLRRLADPDDAAEALNDVMLTAWRRRDQLPDEPREARLWLYGVAANVQRNQRRALVRRAALVRRLRSDPTARRHEDDPGAAVRDAIDALPSELGELVRLRHWEGFTLTEAARVLGIPESTARTRYAAARRRLRATLGAAEEPEPDRGAARPRLEAGTAVHD